jgi:reactive intermediate/imine deaminase
MTNKAIIHTDKAPAAIGTYSQAVKVNNTVYLSGQIPLDPTTMQLVEGDFAVQAHQVFKNLRAVCEAADGGGLNHIVKLNIYLTDLAHFPIVNEVMGQYFTAPFPARAAIGINQLPRNSLIEADGIMVI